MNNGNEQLQDFYKQVHGVFSKVISRIVSTYFYFIIKDSLIIGKISHYFLCFPNIYEKCKNQETLYFRRMIQ